MSVTLKDVEQIAALARLEFSDREKEEFRHQLNEILRYMEKLNELDTSRVEPLSHGGEEGGRLREDVAEPGLTREEALRNAPDRTEEFFRVPHVLGGKRNPDE